MKRFHVHITVRDLQKNIVFYNALFGQDPARQRPDYAQWLLADPAVNFAISQHEQGQGVDHFGFQADSPQVLEVLRQQASAASGDVLDQGETRCCYARSRKHWTVDPQGLAWEHFHTLAETTDKGETFAISTAACCMPGRDPGHDPEQQKRVCCLPADDTSGDDPCSADKADTL